LLCLSPVETLCRVMARDTLPSVALQSWVAQTQGIMALNRQNRRKVRIMDVSMATRHPGDFLGWFTLPKTKEQIAALGRDAQVSGPAAGRDDVLCLLAQRALLGDLAARALLGELEAVSLNFADEAGFENADLDAAFLSYQGMRDTQGQVALLQAQNTLVQQEQEMLAQDRIELGQRFDQVNQGIQDLQRKTREKERALQQAGVMLEDLEAQVGDLHQTLGAEQEKLRRILSSRSYRLTTPLRSLRGLVSRRTPA